ncbi:MAG TPA: potassium-transporting ATPase subunit KdpA [Thermoleophilia bacterium]|nr:potassium-transporting ATPase subunit KdpA [Thermoleophilia bacterium]
MAFGILQIIVYLVLLGLIAKPLGTYMAHVYKGERTFLHPVLRPLERATYRICGVDENREMGLVGYTMAFLVFNFIVIAFIYAVLRLQGHLPLNPAHVPGMNSWDAFNTAASFGTNTNWQVYVPETSVSYLSQMLALARENFVSAAVGMAVAVAFIRGLTRKSTRELGNYWVDFTRSFVYILLPICIVGTLLLVSQGVVQNLDAPTQVKTIEGVAQTIGQGPVASQEIIKELGTNGGGYYNANSAHPFENPTPFTNIIEMLALLAIPVSFTYMFGRFAGNQRQGWALFAAAMVLVVMSVSVMYWSEQRGNPNLTRVGADQALTAQQPGGNFEGKEVRDGISSSALWATVTTVTSTGAVNASHDSLTPLAGGMSMLNIALGEVVFGGVGVGIMGLLIFAILSVFIAGLMVGRTPEYLGKKIEGREMKLAVLATLYFCVTALGLAAIASVVPAGKDAVLNQGPHGLSEILYATLSQTGNNGSAFAGITVSGKFWATAGGLIMLWGRFFFIIPCLALAASLGAKKILPESSGTFPTTGPIFVVLLVGVILIVGALTYFPALALGPIVEQFLMNAGKLFG